QRGIEIESVYASLLFLGSLLGLPLSAEVSHGSVDVVTPVSGLLAKLSPLVLLLGLAVLGWDLWRRRPPDRKDVLRAGLLAVPLTLLCSKVLSAQYFLFGLPLLLLLAAEWDQRRLGRMTALCFVLAALTASVFPYLWFPTFPGTGITNPFCLFPDLHPVPCLVLALRNGLLAAAWLVSWRATARIGGETTAGRKVLQVAGHPIAKSASAPVLSSRTHASREWPRPSWSVAVALGFYTLLGILLKLTHGHFHDLGLMLLTLGFLAYVALGGRAAESGRGRNTWRVVAQRCGLVAVMFAGLQWLDPELIYATVPGLQNWLAPLGSAMLAIALILWLGTWKRVRLPGRLEHAMWLSAVVLAVALRVVAWHASPQPAIDVWVIGNLGCDQLLSGDNPYAAEYPNVYGDAYDHQPHFFYWPGYLLAAAPFRALLGDVRAATVAADVLIVVCLLAAGRSLRLPRKTVRLVCLLWLLHPVSLFVLEQAWIDPLLLGGVAVLVVCLLRNWWAGAGVALAMVVGMKQYGLLIAWLTLVYLGAHRAALPVAPNWRSLLLAGGVTTAVLFGPFLWLDAPAFYASTLEPYLAVELRSDALSIPALIYNGWGVRISDRILGALVLSAVGCVSLVLARSRCDLALLLWASAVALGAFFLLGKLAFCNYYYLVSSLVLWHLLLLLAPSRLLDAERQLVFGGKQPSAAR
ncbi:MAG: hypothetical protein J5I93_20965, partial [Pirellulaceae bacterium]|nr:hypothetical protein [Pirellulaceae bacterium]